MVNGGEKQRLVLHEFRRASCRGGPPRLRSLTTRARRSGFAGVLALAALSTELNAQTTAVPSAASGRRNRGGAGPDDGCACRGHADRCASRGHADGPARPPVAPQPDASGVSEHVACAEHLALDALISRVAALRSRIAALASTMFSSKLRIEVRAQGDTVRLESMHVSVDGGVVYTAPTRAVFEQPAIVYEHAVAPG